MSGIQKISALGPKKFLFRAWNYFVPILFLWEIYERDLSDPRWITYMI